MNNFNMRKFLILAGTTFALTVSAAMVGVPEVQAAKISNGTIEFRGTIVSGVCDVSMDSRNMLVDMGKHQSQDFKGVGSKSREVAFDIKLENCDGVNTATVTFDGSTAPGNYQLYTPNAEDPNNAGNIGLGIWNSAGVLTTPGMEAEPEQISDGDTTLHYKAAYVATGSTVHPGTANVSVMYKISYN